MIYSAVNFQNSKLLRNHVQIVYWMKEKIIWELTIVDKPHSNCVLNERKIIWELTIIDKPQSNCISNEGNKHLRT